MHHRCETGRLFVGSMDPMITGLELPDDDGRCQSEGLKKGRSCLAEKRDFHEGINDQWRLEISRWWVTATLSDNKFQCLRIPSI